MVRLRIWNNTKQNIWITKVNNNGIIENNDNDKKHENNEKNKKNDKEKNNEITENNEIYKKYYNNENNEFFIFNKWWVNQELDLLPMFSFLYQNI